MSQSIERESHEFFKKSGISPLFDPFALPLVDAKAIFVQCCSTERILMQKGVIGFLKYEQFDLNRKSFEGLIHPLDLVYFQQFTRDGSAHQKFNCRGQLHITFRILTGLGTYLPIEQISGYFSSEKKGKGSAEYFILRNDLFSSSPFEVRTKIVEMSFVKKSKTPSIDVLQQLTNRQNHLLSLIAKGYQNKRIGAELFISPETVRSHKKQMVSRCGCVDISELLDFYHQGKSRIGNEKK